MRPGPTNQRLTLSEHQKRSITTVRISLVSEPDLDDFAVDPSRVTYGLRRYWWVIALCVVAGLLAALVPGTSPAAFDIELRESASRTRLGARPDGEIALLEFGALVDVMNSTDRQDAVDELAGEAVSYTASVTPTGLLALRVVAPSQESARQQSSYVVEVLDDWLLNEQREVVGQRVAELTQSTESLSEKIDSINFSTGDDVTAILERSSLIDALVQLLRYAPLSRAVRPATRSYLALSPGLSLVWQLPPGSVWPADESETLPTFVESLTHCPCSSRRPMHRQARQRRW